MRTIERDWDWWAYHYRVVHRGQIPGIGQWDDDLVELVASSAGAAKEGELERMAGTVDELIPFTEGQRVQVPVLRPRWDDPDALTDPPAGEGWPSEIQIRLSSRPAVYHLPRYAVGALGIEGELLLGLRAGEAILPELS